MSIFMFLSLIGGLALFLYGMDTMSAGLAKLTGGKLQEILQRLTSNKWKACLLGVVVTAIIQSSSSTTVMVVGMVNSGILKLSQVVGIIFGANIGTTVTAWVLSLTGIQGDSFFVQLLKPTTFSPIIAMIGVIMIMAAKEASKKDIGRIMVGFAILMFGMETMSAAVKPLGDNPAFAQAMTYFRNPLLGVLMGTVITAIIQSSSASVGILQALSLTGNLNYGITIPIIFGQNIGTCITSILSAIGTNKNAKSAALVHLYFNIIGTGIFMIVYFIATTLFNIAFLDQVTTPVGIAIIHSIFNISSTIVLMPFSEQITKLAVKTLQGKEEEVPARTLSKLDPLFLSNPSYAVRQAHEVSVKLGRDCLKSLRLSFPLITEFDVDKYDQIVAIEQKIDEYEDSLGSYLVKLSGIDLSEKDHRLVSILMNSLGDFERISDHITVVAENCKEKHKVQGKFTKTAIEELTVFQEALEAILEKTVQAFENLDLEQAYTIEPLEEVIDRLNGKVKKNHIKRLQQEICSIDMGFILINITTSYSRISDHCSNIGVAMIEIMEDDFQTHQYLEDLKGDPQFKKKVKEYKARYKLPEAKTL